MAEVDATRGRRPSRRRTRPNTGPDGSTTAVRTATDQAGRSYLLGPRLREGGNVYEASSSHSIAPVVVRLFPSAARIGERALSAFTHEVTLSTALDHPNVARVLGAGTLDDGTPFLVTERLQGETLKEVLVRGPLSAAEAHAVVAGVTTGLSVARAAGLPHGALRPEDVFVVEGDFARIKLLNFGAHHLAKKKRAKTGPLDAPSPPDDGAALASFVKSLRRPSGGRAASARPARRKGKASVAPRERRSAKAGDATIDPSSVSQLFFNEGERLSNEAMAAHAALSSATLVIPRRRGPMVAWTIGILLAMTGLALGGWLSVRKPLAAGRAAAAPVMRVPEPSSSVDTPPAPPKPETTPPDSSRARTAVARPAQRPVHERHARFQAATPALRGYVWSPKEQRLVPKTLAPKAPPPSSAP